LLKVRKESYGLAGVSVGGIGMSVAPTIPLYVAGNPKLCGIVDIDWFGFRSCDPSGGISDAGDALISVICGGTGDILLYIDDLSTERNSHFFSPSH
jgi:hypothetical protein